MSILPAGKLSNRLLQKLLAKIGKDDKQVMLGPAIGQDATIIRMEKHLLVAKTDPVTLASDHIGWYAVHVNANDVATRGVKPRWFMASILLPEKATSEEAERIFDQILSACKSLGVSLVGGHTEITPGLQQPIVAGCMLGEADEDVITTGLAQVGDDIILTRSIAIEGTAALAREAAPALRDAGVSQELINRAASYLFVPGISIVREALIAGNRVNSMHDPTEGGLATGLLEVATVAKAGVLIDASKIPVLPECQVICRALKLNPLGLLASGALLLTLPSHKTEALLEDFARAGIEATSIGKIVSPNRGMKIRDETGIHGLPQFKRDELASFLEKQNKEK